MAEERALTNIKGGSVKGQKQVATVVPDVDETLVREGETVKKGNFSDEEWERLKAGGTVTEDPKDLVRPKTYKASTVQAAAHEEAVTRTGNELPDAQDDTNPDKAQSPEETNKQATENARKARDAEREFDERLANDPDFRAELLTGYENQPRQHQAVIHASKQDYIAEKVTGDEPRAVPGRKKSTATKSESKGGE